MDFGSALLAILTAFVVKGAVLIFGARLLFRVYGVAYARRPPRRLWLLLPREHLLEVRVLWWSFLLFAISEVTCGIEIFVLFQSSPLISGIHAIVSATAMALFALGLYLLLDRKVFHFGAPACVGLRVCRACTMPPNAPTATGACRFRVLLIFVATFLALAVIPPLLAPTDPMFADARKYVLPFESWNRWYDEVIVPWLTANMPGYQPSGVSYFLPHAMLAIEFRVLPAVAGALAIAAIVLLVRRRERRALPVLMLAFGALCYVYFELVLYAATHDVIAGSLGHEIGEFWFLLATAELLRRTFHEGSGS